jgi:hypothetical protein
MSQDVDFKYLFAEKNGRTLCLKYDEDWELSTFEYLMSKKYSLRPASEAHWNRQIDETGQPAECYLLDNSLSVFDIGSW